MPALSPRTACPPLPASWRWACTRSSSSPVRHPGRRRAAGERAGRMPGTQPGQDRRPHSAHARPGDGWARRTFDTFIVFEADGSVRDHYAYPLIAFRELVANALIHRDLDDWSAGLAIEVRLRRDRLVIASPGGLYGINVHRLGRDPVTSARNRQLVEICQHVYSTATGARAVEALATGIPLVTESLREAGLPPARYFDSGIRFTVMLRQRSSVPVLPSGRRFLRHPACRAVTS